MGCLNPKKIVVLNCEYITDLNNTKMKQKEVTVVNISLDRSLIDHKILTEDNKKDDEKIKSPLDHITVRKETKLPLGVLYNDKNQMISPQLSDNEVTFLTKSINNKSTQKSTRMSLDSGMKMFGLKLLREFNHARTDPISYAKKLEKMMQYIHKWYDDTTKQMKVFFLLPGGSQVALLGGETTFWDTIKFLNSAKPTIELKWNDDLLIDLQHEIDFSKEFIENIILEKKDNLKDKYNNLSFNLDIFAEPEISAVFQIIDEAFNGKRRETIFNPQFKNFAVSFRKDEKKKYISLSCFAGDPVKASA